MIDFINQIKDTGLFSSLDIHFAKYIAENEEEEKFKEVVFIAALLSSYGLMGGHIAIDLDNLPFPDGFPEILKRKAKNIKDLLQESSLTKKDNTPLKVEGKRLYLQRYYSYEESLAESINEKNQELKPALSYDEDKLKNLFCDDTVKENIALSVMNNGMTVITGGPGTGKTTVIAKILYLLVSQNRDLRFALAAPTGKAAARMTEAIKNALERDKDNYDESLIANILEHKGSTIHRLLGFKRNSVEFKYNNNKRLPYDVVIVDEASMVDLTLMQKLFSALGDNSRIVLIGDKDQLASVEAGSIFADICAGLKKRPPFFELMQNFRFSKDSQIWSSAQAVNRGVVPENLDQISVDDEKIKQLIHEFYKPFIVENDPAKALEKYNKFRILCATRKWKGSVTEMNQLVEETLKIKKDHEFYESRPIMITENCYNLKLFNGDTGIVKKNEQGETRAWFEVEGVLKPYVPAILPEHETAFATTIHKSQGSEFDNVLVILPDDTANPILTKELLYTGITRAKENIYMRATKEIIKSAVEREVIRNSGLEDKIK